MESGFLLDVVIRKGTAILKLLTGEDQALLVRRDTVIHAYFSTLGIHARIIELTLPYPESCF